MKFGQKFCISKCRHSRSLQLHLWTLQ